MTALAHRPALGLRLLHSWVAPHRAIRALRGMGEPSMLAVLIAALLLFFVAQVPGHMRAAAADPSMALAPRLAGAGLAVVFLMPLMAYGLAQLVALASRATPRPLAPADSRLALFWALLAVAPAMLLAGAAQPPLLTPARWLAGLGFLWLWLGGIAGLSGGRT